MKETSFSRFRMWNWPRRLICNDHPSIIHKQLVIKFFNKEIHTTMKSINKILLIVLTAVTTASLFTSCTKDKSSGDTPSINYVRITRPTSSDSLLVAAGQGQLIAIIGNNLEDAVEVWFNDQQARLTPT